MANSQTLFIMSGVFPMAAPMLLPAALAVKQGEVAADQAKAEAQMEREAAASRTDERLRQVRQLRASQRTAAAAAGVAQNAGSTAAIEEDLRSRARMRQYAENYESKYRISSLNAQAKNARTMGWINAGTSLIDTGFDVGSLAMRLG